MSDVELVLLFGQYSRQAAYSLQAISSRGGVWGQVFGGFAGADGDSNYAGYDASYGGLIAGVDGMAGDDVTIGVFGSYSFSSVDGDGAGNAQIDASNFGLGVYAGYAGDGFYLDGFAAYAMAQNDLSRTAVVGAFSETVTANYDASQFSVGLAGGVPIAISPNLVVTPNASLTWNSCAADGYTEPGALGQTVRPDAVGQLTGTIGTRIHAVFENVDNEGTQVVPELRLALAGDVFGDDATAMMNFASGGTTYQVSGADTSNLGALIGLGLSLNNHTWSAGFTYDAELRSDLISHTARAEFRWKF